MLDASIYSMTTLARNWWALVLRGIVAVLFGLIAWFWPSLALNTLILLFVAFALSAGILTIVAAVRSIEANLRWVPLLIEGLISVGAGIVALVWPDLAAKTFLYVIAVWAILSGILEISAAVRLRREIEGEWLLAMSGLAGIVFGIIAIARPQSGALAVLWLIGISAIFIGAVLIALGWRLRGMRSELEAASSRLASTPPGAEPTTGAPYTTGQAPGSGSGVAGAAGVAGVVGAAGVAGVVGAATGRADAEAVRAASEVDQPVSEQADMDGTATDLPATEPEPVFEEAVPSDAEGYGATDRPIRGEGARSDVDFPVTELENTVADADPVAPATDDSARDDDVATADVDLRSRELDLDPSDVVLRAPEADLSEPHIDIAVSEVNTTTPDLDSAAPDIDVLGSGADVAGSGTDAAVPDIVPTVPELDVGLDNTDVGDAGTGAAVSEPNVSGVEPPTEGSVDAGVVDERPQSPIDETPALDDESEQELFDLEESASGLTINGGPQSGPTEASGVQGDDSALGSDRSSEEEVTTHEGLTVEAPGPRRSISDTLDGSFEGNSARSTSDSDFWHAGASPDAFGVSEFTAPESLTSSASHADVSTGVETVPHSGQPDTMEEAEGEPDVLAAADADMRIDTDGGFSGSEPEILERPALEEASIDFAGEAAAGETDEHVATRRVSAEEQRLAELFASMPPEGADWVRGDGTDSCPPDYSIKGNATSRIFHVPGGRSYADTIPEICFATPDTAASAGFRPRKGDPVHGLATDTDTGGNASLESAATAVPVSAEADQASMEFQPASTDAAASETGFSAAADADLRPDADGGDTGAAAGLVKPAGFDQPSGDTGEVEPTDASEEPAASRRLTAEEYRLTRLLASLPPEGAGWVRGDGSDTCPPGYSIKGNASSRIYHVTGGQSYADTRPEICFSTPDDAVSAGFRARKGDPEFVPPPAFDEGN